MRRHAVHVGSAVAGISIALLAGTGCGSAGGHRARTTADHRAKTSPGVFTPAPRPARAKGARVAFIIPKTGAVLAPSFVAIVKVSGFHISLDGVGKAPRPGYGHLNFSLDGGRFDTPSHAPASASLARRLRLVGKDSPAGLSRVSYRDIPPGTHTLTVYLVNNDNTNAGVQQSVVFSVR